MTDEYPQILKTEQVAELLGISVDTVRRAAREGTLPAYRLPGGRTHRFFKDEILEWLRSRPSGPSLPAPDTQPDVPATPGVVQQAVRAAISEGQVLHTPTRHASFKVDTIDTDGVVLLLGKGEWASRLSWDHLEGVIPYIRRHGGVIDIGGRHQVEGRPGTLDGYLKTCVGRTTAGWVAVLLATAGLIEVLDERPARLRVI